MDILGQLLAQDGLTRADVKPNTNLGQLLRTRGVHPGPDFARIRALPRRDWATDPNLPELISRMTAWLRTPTGTQTLFPMQAAALAEFAAFGSYVNASMSCGKSLVAFLAPVVGGFKAPLFLTYKKLIEKSRLHCLADKTNWRVCENLTYYSVERFSRDSTILDTLNPDCIIIDESQAFKNPTSGRSKRLRAWLKAHPGVRVLPLTATQGDSISHHAHIAFWSLGKGSPLPITWNEATQWAEALDVDSDGRLAPGCLLELDEEPKATIDDVRAAVGRRCAATPGYISCHVPDFPCPLWLTGEVFDGYGEATEAAFISVRDNATTPAGKELTEGSEIWRVLRSLSLGFVHYIVGDPPEEWVRARRDWNRFCSDDLSHNRSGRCTPLDVTNACLRGELDATFLEAWRAVKPLFKMVSAIQWIDDAAIHFCREWMRTDAGVVWTPFPAWGHRLAELSGVPYFGAKGLSREAGDTELYQGRNAILSVGANAVGRNLQRWNRALVVGPDSAGDTHNQLVGRHHRRGQTAERVDVSYLLGCIDNLEALEKARSRQAADRDINSNGGNRFLVADWLLPSSAELQLGASRRWRKR